MSPLFLHCLREREREGGRTNASTVPLQLISGGKEEYKGGAAWRWQWGRGLSRNVWPGEKAGGTGLNWVG